MTQETIKKRLERYKAKTLNSLLENYPIVEKAEYPFHFRVHDPNGVKYIRVESNALDASTKEAIERFKKTCPSNTVFQVRIFEKYQQTPDSIFL